MKVSYEESVANYFGFHRGGIKGTFYFISKVQCPLLWCSFNVPFCGVRSLLWCSFFYDPCTLRVFDSSDTRSVLPLRHLVSPECTNGDVLLISKNTMSHFQCSLFNASSISRDSLTVDKLRFLNRALHLSLNLNHNYRPHRRASVGPSIELVRQLNCP